MSTNVSEMSSHLAESSSKKLGIGSWVTTGLVSAMMAVSGLLYLAGAKPAVEAMTTLGYPAYFMTMLGAAKLLGAIALVAPRVPATLREWAYAGFTFDLLAAFVSHAATGGGAQAPIPLFVLALLLGSYFTRRRLHAKAY